MGYMRHHAIIVTSCLDDHLEWAHQAAIGMFDNVSPIIPSKMNGYRSFFIPPDGSKEEREESDRGNAYRKVFLQMTIGRAFPDGSNPLDVVEIEYGGDEPYSIQLKINRPAREFQEEHQ